MLNNLVAQLGTGAGASASSFESIATANGTGSSGTITFSSIPSTYKHLQIRINGRTTTAGSSFNAALMTLNNDSANNYATHYLQGDGTTATASAVQPAGYILAGQASQASQTAPSTAVVDIIDYANTSKNKTVRTMSGSDFNGSGTIRLSSGVWLSTTAVNQVSFLVAGFWTTDTTFALYGIKG